MKVGKNIREYAIYFLGICVVLAMVYRGLEYIWEETKPIVAKGLSAVTSKPEINFPVRKIEDKLKILENENLELKKMLVNMRIPDSSFSLRDKLTFVYPYEEEEKFPAFIWQSWKYGLRDENFGSKYKEYEAEWTILNPGFVHDLFNDDTSYGVVQYLYKNIPEVIEAYEKLPMEILRVDFFKYLILFAKGGVYADIDSMPLQPVPNWIPDGDNARDLGMVIGIECDAVNPNSWQGVFSRRLQFGNFIMQSKAGHPILREIIAAITELSLKGEFTIKDINDRAFGVDLMNWTGGGLLTDSVFQYFADHMVSEVYHKVSWKDLSRLKDPRRIGDILIMPVNSFAAGPLPAHIPPNHVSSDDENLPGALARHDRARLYAEDNLQQVELVN